MTVVLVDGTAAGDQQLVERFLFDANITRTVVDKWHRFDDMSSDYTKGNSSCFGQVPSKFVHFEITLIVRSLSRAS